MQDRHPRCLLPAGRAKRPCPPRGGRHPGSAQAATSDTASVRGEPSDRHHRSGHTACTRPLARHHAASSSPAWHTGPCPMPVHRHHHPEGLPACPDRSTAPGQQARRVGPRLRPGSTRACTTGRPAARSPALREVPCRAFRVLQFCRQAQRTPWAQRRRAESSSSFPRPLHLLQPSGRLPQPRVESHIVAVSQAMAGIDTMEHGRPLMMGSDPGPIDVGHLVIGPGERASRSPLDEGTGLPVQSVPYVLVIDVGRLRPGHHGQLRQTDAGRDALVRVRHPCRRPDELARECRQPGSVLGIDPGQERIRVGTSRFRTRRTGRIRLGHGPERNERPDASPGGIVHRVARPPVPGAPSAAVGVVRFPVCGLSG